MREPLVLAVAQPHSVLGDVAANAQTHAETIMVAAARVVVFPELSLTGYTLEPQGIDPHDERLAPIVDACASTGAIALAGAPTRNHDGLPHISMLAIDGGGATIAYKKMWLGGDEPHVFCPGGSPRILEIDGWRLGLAICKDTGVPEHAIKTTDLGMDVYVAGVCETEHDREVQSQRAARVIADHGVWVAVASFAGPTGGGFAATAGRSSIWRNDGERVTSLDRRPGQFATGTISESSEALE